MTDGFLWFLKYIIRLIVKRRKMMIDQDEEDVISYGESEIRIISFC